MMRNEPEAYTALAQEFHAVAVQSYCYLSDMNHGVIVIEVFILALLARYAYRRPEPKTLEPTMADNRDSFDSAVHNSSQAVIEFESCRKSSTYDVGTPGIYTANDNLTFKNDV